MIRKLLFHFLLPILLTTFFSYLLFQFFSPIFQSQTIIIKYGLRPFNICTEQPFLWKIICYLFVFSSIFFYFMLFHFLCTRISKIICISFKCKKNSSYHEDSSLHLDIGFDYEHHLISIPEKGLYQNILITGTIGSGKTSSAMYPFTKQLMTYQCQNNQKKLGMLILDVKGNYYKQVLKYAKELHREKDLISIDLNGHTFYNPLHKPDLKASVLANRLKTILLLFSPNNTESFWIDKVETVLMEAIKLCRLYNHGYVTFEEIHSLILYPSYYQEKIHILRNLFLHNAFSKEDIYQLLSSLNFFEKEYQSLDERTLSILKSEITRITNLFISDYAVKETFSPPLEKLNFTGFSDVIQSGKIVVLNMSIADYKNLAKVLAAYLKLDFQTEVMNRLSRFDFSDRPVCFISDEYAEYVTSTDADFFAQSREAKCINIVATQSYTSLLNTIQNDAAVKVILQNLVNKLWFRTDDLYTIDIAQKQIGKEEKKKISTTISENAKETKFNYLFNRFLSKDSNVSESYNAYFQTDFIFDTHFFTQELSTFSCLSFLSDGHKILSPQKLDLIPYFHDHSTYF